MALFCRRKGCLAIAYYRLCGRLFSSAASSSSSTSSAPPLPSLRPPPVVASLHTPPALRFSITMMRSPSALAMLAVPFLARNCTSTAYRPPAPPGEFEGGDDGEADGTDVSGDGSGDANALPDGAGDVNTPPEAMYDDSIYDDDGECEEEDPPPDPEESCLYSPSDSD